MKESIINKKFQTKYFSFMLCPFYLRIGGRGTVRRDWVNYWVFELSYVNHQHYNYNIPNTRREIYFGIFKLLEYKEGGSTDKFKKRGFFNIFLIN